MEKVSGRVQDIIFIIENWIKWHRDHSIRDINFKTN